LIEKSGWSHRHVTSRFRSQVGVTPKVAAGVIRFERAAAAVPAEAPLADVAARYGYADQSHLTREFVRLAGRTPHGYATSPGLPCLTSESTKSRSFKTP
jgi:transcriptional regulator GlxA family with amidase domain